VSPSLGFLLSSRTNAFALNSSLENNGQLQWSRRRCQRLIHSFHSSWTKGLLITSRASTYELMAPKPTRKKTDIPVPEPRHRVGPKGVSSGISFRQLPPPSLGEIKKVCEHYQTKCAGTYNSLASRYVYQMATEIEDLVEALEGGGYGSEGSMSSLGDCEPFARFRDSATSQRSRKQRNNSSVDDHWNREIPKRGNGSTSKTSFERPPTRHSRHSKTGDRKSKEIRFDFAHDDDDDSTDVPSYRGRQPYVGRQKYNTRSTTASRYDDNILEQRNFEDQVEEVLGWLKDEMERSQSFVHRSRQIHDAELANAKREMDKLKKAAKRIIKAVHKKGKDKAARSEATADSERRRRIKSQKTMASMIKSQSAQMEHLKRGLHRNSTYNNDSDSLAGLGLDLEDDSHAMRNENNPAELFSLAGDSDLTSILDGLAEEAYRQSCYH